MVRHNQLRWTAASSTGRVGGAAVGIKAGSPPLASGAAGPATIENFEKKLAEADSYLQLLLGE